MTDHHGETPLHIAFRWAEKEIIMLLLSNKAEVNARNKDGQTPWDEAVAYDNFTVADLLKQFGGTK